MLVLKLDFCASNIIDHFSCDYFPNLQLSFSDTWLLERIGFYFAFVALLFTLALVILSYICVITTILRIPSATQRKKAFSTCTSHLIVISISYGCCMFIYVKSLATERSSLTKGVAGLNTSVAPMLNSFISNLRNQQLKQTCKDLAHKVVFFRSKWKYVLTWMNVTVRFQKDRNDILLTLYPSVSSLELSGVELIGFRSHFFLSWKCLCCVFLKTICWFKLAIDLQFIYFFFFWDKL
jgi:hypothetical protein